MKPSGPKLARKFRRQNKLTLAAAGALVGTDWGSWRAYESGDRLPSLPVAVRIQRVTGIPCESWVESLDLQKTRVVKIDGAAA